MPGFWAIIAGVFLEMGQNWRKNIFRHKKGLDFTLSLCFIW
jgi:hypothetical protein